MDDVWPRFLNATFENWQSEWLQLVLQAVVLLGLKHVLFKADAQDMEQVQLDLAEPPVPPWRCPAVAATGCHDLRSARLVDASPWVLVVAVAGGLAANVRGLGISP